MTSDARRTGDCGIIPRMKSSFEKADGDRLGWAGPVLAAAAFAAVFIAFVWQLSVYWRNVRAWAEQDLQSRADLAAIVLAEPLRTLDLKAVQSLGAACRADGLRLRICHGPTFFDVSETDEGRRGFYDTMGEADVPCLFKVAKSGSYVIGVGRPSARMLRPFLMALVVIVLAGLLGVAGVVLFFVATWRQRLRIRALARLERFRREFLADLSHEIKTPLAGVLGAADLLAEEAERRDGGGRPGPGNAPLLAKMILKEGGRLNALVQQVLDLARLEREGEAVRPEPVDLAELVREAVARHAASAASKGVSLAVAPSSPATCAAFGDPTLLAQALDNLVANALRHSGAPNVRVSCGVSGADCFLAVEDDGCGVPPGQALRIFERFHRLDPARAAESGGAGLGLAIVRRIARLHGGEAACAPAVPHGARFTVTWRRNGRPARGRGRAR